MIFKCSGYTCWAVVTRSHKGVTICVMGLIEAEGRSILNAFYFSFTQRFRSELFENMYTQRFRSELIEQHVHTKVQK